MSNHNTPQTLPPQTKLREFVIENKIGEGSFGIVYTAVHEFLGETVAVKEFLPSSLACRTDGNRVEALPGSHKEYEWAREKFLQEARTLKALDDPQPHPNLVQVIHAFSENDTVYMCMRYEQGKPLDKVLRERGPLSEQELKDILFPLLDGLEHAHAKGVWHRDIKPSNILIREDDGSPVLIDFGAARQDIGNRDRSIMAQCTPGYAAPEQLWGSDEQGPWTDIYALGATLYQAITGQPPQGFSRTALHENIQGAYSERFLACIDQALEPKPDERPRTVKEWRECFEAVSPTRQNENADAPTVLRTTSGTQDETRLFNPQTIQTRSADPVQQPPTMISPETSRAPSEGGPAQQPPQVPDGPMKNTERRGAGLWVSLGIVLIGISGLAIWQLDLLPSDPATAPQPPPPVTPNEPATPTIPQPAPPPGLALEPAPEPEPKPNPDPKPKPEPEPEPEPALAEPIPTGLTAAQKTATLTTVGDLISGLACAQLKATLSSDRALSLTGHISSSEELAELRRRLLPLANIDQIEDDGIQIYGAPFCQVLSTLMEVMKNTDDRTKETTIAFNKPDPLYKEGEFLVVTATNNNPQAGYIYLDFVDSAGDVVHMLPNQFDPKNQVASLDEIVIGAEGAKACRQRQCYEIFPPHGRSLLVAIWSRDPLQSHPRQEMVEPAADYFLTLAGIILDAVNNGANELSLSYRFLETKQ